MDYEVVQKFRGAKIVAYRCPTCGIDLESPLEEAGTEQTCPTCGGPFTSPGLPELLKDQQERREQHEREEKERIEAEWKAAVEREQKERQRLAPPPPPPRPELVWYGKMYCNNCGYTWQARRKTPPARCPSCSKRNITPVRVPRATGCLTCVLLVIAVAGALTVAGSLFVPS
jgi:rubrerythrin